jgi:Domain of unknown function (DUF6984)
MSRHVKDTEFTHLDRPRPLSHPEQEVLARLLAEEFPGSEQLREQQKSVVVALDHGSHCPTIGLAVDPRAPRASVLTRVPISGSTTAADGMLIEVLLHVVDGRLSELEALRYDDEPLSSFPDPASLVLFVPE